MRLRFPSVLLEQGERLTISLKVFKLSKPAGHAVWHLRLERRGHPWCVETAITKEMLDDATIGDEAVVEMNVANMRRDLKDFEART